jgi:hypothetical protein
MSYFGLSVSGITLGLRLTEIEIRGVFVCADGSQGPGNSVTLSNLSHDGIPSPYQATFLTDGIGGFKFQHIPAWGPPVRALKCGDTVTFQLSGLCEGETSDVEVFSFEILCGACPRVALQASYGACSGVPPQQAVTLSAIVNLLPGDSWDCYWEFGDGQNSQSFHVANLPTGTQTTPLPIPPIGQPPVVHPYSPGGWTAYLRNRTPDNECPETSISINATCPTSGCPNVTLSAGAPGPCLNGKRRVTLNAVVNSLPASAVFHWDFGDGSIGHPKNATVVGVWPSPPDPTVNEHDYVPGQWTATLINDSDPTCTYPPLTFTVLPCPTCPDVTLSAGAPGPCLNGNRRVTLNAVVKSLPASAVFHWDFGDGSIGHPKNATIIGAWPSPPDPSVNEHDYAPGTWNATLINDLDPTCSYPPVTFTVDPCPDCCPDLSFDPQNPVVTGCAPNSVVAAFAAKLDWKPGCTPVTATSFEWTLDGPGGTKYLKSTTLPSTDTTAGWTDAGGNPAVVQFIAGGNYSVAVVAIVPGFSTRTPPCLPRDTAAFTVNACCPQLIGPLNASEKPGDPCTWLFSAQVSNPNGASVTFEWSFQDGATDSTLLPQVEHTYTPGSSTTGMTTVTLKSPGCPDQSLSATITQMCQCPTVGTPSAAVTVSATGPATVAFSTSAPPSVSSFDWTVTTPDGTLFTKTTTIPSTTDGTSDGAWTNSSTGATGALDLSATGAYAVAVKAKGATVGLSCPQPPANAFTIPAPPKTKQQALSCDVRCTLGGIFAIALPISAYLSSIAHCLNAQWEIVLYTLILSAVIGIFIAQCGICCTWLFLMIGCVLGAIATAVAAYWLGFPRCLAQAITLAAGFMAMAFAFLISCLLPPPSG